MNVKVEKAMFKARKAIAIAELTISLMKQLTCIVKNHKDDGLGEILVHQLKGQYESQLMAIRATSFRSQGENVKVSSSQDDYFCKVPVKEEAYILSLKALNEDTCVVSKDA